MRFITGRNIYVRINRHLDAHCPGQKLRKSRSRSADPAGSYYLENPDGSITEIVNLEQLAKRLGCLKKYERIGVPPRLTGKEAKLVVNGLAEEIAAGRALQRRIARDIARITKW